MHKCVYAFIVNVVLNHIESSCIFISYLLPSSSWHHPTHCQGLLMHISCNKPCFILRYSYFKFVLNAAPNFLSSEKNLPYCFKGRKIENCCFFPGDKHIFATFSVRKNYIDLPHNIFDFQ